MITAKNVVSARELAAQIRLRSATATAARYQAKSRVKEMLRAQGRKINEFSAKDLALLAEDYFASPRGLVRSIAAKVEVAPSGFWDGQRFGFVHHTAPPF